MKKLLFGLLFFISTIYFAQPVMDGVFDGAGIWGSAKATADNAPGWASANSVDVYVTNDNNYIYLGAHVTASDWMSWCFLINTKTGGGSSDSWSRNITNTHTNLPDYSIRGNFNNGWTEINIWDGSSWTGIGTNIGNTEHGDGINGTAISGWIEVRVSRVIISNILGDVEFFITGDSTDHGSFDACPDDDNSTDWSGTPAHSDLVNYISAVPLPVELTSFTASASGKNVKLNWSTATEVNNYGFQVQRKTVNKNNWDNISFVQGNGNSNSPKNYSYTDKNVSFGKYNYRLKQIDTDGKFEYSDVVEVQAGEIPNGFVLKQNYPNPFNPATNIVFAVDKTSPVKLTVYNMLGSKVAELFNGQTEGGQVYNIAFDASKLSGGVYFYKLASSEKTIIKKMMLIK